MATKKKTSCTLALVSLGCAKNAADLEVRAGNLLTQGFTLSPDPDRADIVVVNTCAFIKSARDEAEAEIRRAVQLKLNGNYKKVVVTGCYPQRYPNARAKFPGVDNWQGVPKEWIEPKMPALRFTGKAFAYLKIAEGCAHKCSYCAIPNIRGKYRSRPMRSILREAKALLETGCRELNIVAQDPMLYGIDLQTGPKTTLVTLLKKIDQLPGKFWVRVLYTYPSEITEDYINWLNTSPHAVKYADIPLQHTEPEVLRLMNRGAAIEATRSAAEKLRLAVPGITLRTTIMTGFPSESKARFERMRAEVKRMQFDHLGAFAFSPEEGTKAFALNCRPARAIAEMREKIIMADAEEMWKSRSARLVDTVQEGLIIAPGVARLASQAPDVDGVTYLVADPKDKTPPPEVGAFVNLRITAVTGFDLEGELV